MDPSVLLKLVATGQLDLNPTVESQMNKLRKQKQRASKKATDKKPAKKPSAKQQIVSND